jgi:hypothetical protein
MFYSGLMLCRLTNGDLNRLQTVQNKALKTVYGLENRYSTSVLFTKIVKTILPVKAIGYFNLLLLVKKYILNEIELRDNDWKLDDSCRRSLQIKFSRFKKNILGSDLVCLGPIVFNQLPPEIRVIEKHHKFKKELKAYLLVNEN